MAKSISTLKSEIQRKLHGTNLNKLSGVYSLIGEAAGNILAEIDPQETIRTTQITNGLFTDIYDYTAPSDLKGNKVVDFRPQANRTRYDNFTQKFSEDFDMDKADNTFYVKYTDGTRSIRISKETITSPTILNGMDSITSNGTWAVGSDATNLTKDTVYYVQGGASLNFDVSGAGTTAYIENSTMTQVDLSSMDEQGSLFVRVYIPSGQTITNLILRWGNDTSNYWSRTVTAQHDGTSFETGWNILRFDWNGATETGTVAPAAIDYLRVTFTYDGNADTDFRVDSITASLAEIYDLVYYSKYLFTNASGSYLEIPTADTDTINLDTESYNILLYEVGELVAQELQGEDASFDLQYFAQKKQQLYQRYKRNNPSQESKPQDRYYRIFSPNRRSR